MYDSFSTLNNIKPLIDITLAFNMHFALFKAN